MSAAAGSAGDRWNAAITWLDEPLVRSSSGALAGKTLLVKDLIDTAGIRTTYGSRVYTDHVPQRNATVVDRVLDAGAAVLGKANLAEFAWGVVGSNQWYGTVRNPVRPGRTTGGSSSGNAAAIAAGLCDLGIGTDTGCSVRLPAAACELVGLKTRVGVVPTDGVFPLAPSFDTVGPLARTVQDAAALWSVLAGRAVPEPRLAGLRVGILRQAPNLADGRETEASDAAEEWVGRLEQLGAHVVEAADLRSAGGHLAGVPARGGPLARGDVPEPRGRVRDRDPQEARGRAPRAGGRRHRGLPLAALVAAARAGRRPLRLSVRRDRLAARGGRRARGAPAPVVVPALGQPARAGRDSRSGTCSSLLPLDETVLAAGLAWERG